MNDYNTVVMCITDVPRKNQYGFKQGASDEGASESKPGSYLHNLY